MRLDNAIGDQSASLGRKLTRARCSPCSLGFKLTRARCSPCSLGIKLRRARESTCSLSCKLTRARSSPCSLGGKLRRARRSPCIATSPYKADKPFNNIHPLNYTQKILQIQQYGNILIFVTITKTRQNFSLRTAFHFHVQSHVIDQLLNHDRL